MVAAAGGPLGGGVVAKDGEEEEEGFLVTRRASLFRPPLSPLSPWMPAAAAAVDVDLGLVAMVNDGGRSFSLSCSSAAMAGDVADDVAAAAS